MLHAHIEPSPAFSRFEILTRGSETHLGSMVCHSPRSGCRCWAALSSFQRPYAASSGKPRASNGTTLLLDHRVNISRIMRYGRTALHLAGRRVHVEVSRGSEALISPRDREGEDRCSSQPCQDIRIGLQPGIEPLEAFRQRDRPRFWRLVGPWVAECLAAVFSLLVKALPFL